MQKNKKVTPEARSVKRYLKRHGETKKLDEEWVDITGGVHESKIAAQISSFGNIVMGCFKRGFPVVVPKLFYSAWAFYPFIFVRKDFKGDAISMFGHEFCHIAQQRDIHLTISLPILVILFIIELFFGMGTLTLLGCLFVLPFIPTIIYALDFIRVMRRMIIAKERDGSLPEITVKSVRENTCFEREAISHCMNEEYLKTRKFWGVLAYTGWKRFEYYL